MLGAIIFFSWASELGATIFYAEASELHAIYFWGASELSRGSVYTTTASCQETASCGFISFSVFEFGLVLFYVYPGAPGFPRYFTWRYPGAPGFSRYR